MKQYYKNKQSVTRPKSLIYKGKTYLNPSDEILIQAGYEIKDIEPVKPVITNETIKRQRALAYKMRADHYFIAYQAYTDLGELDKANEMKELWIEERNKIDQEYPYLAE